MLLIDSSAIVKFFSKEDGWEAVTEYIGSSLTIPLGPVELGSALLKKVRKGEIRMEVAVELLSEYSKNAVLVEQSKHLGTALEIAISNNLAIYDSLFLAAALDEGHDLLSFDNKQIKVAKSLGIKTVSL